MKMKRGLDWPAVAVALAAAMPVGRLHAGAVSAGLAERGPWGLAFSGGADSLALLLLLWAHWPERRRRMVALHFNHRLRGRAAKADAAFCARVCAGLGVRFEIGEWEGAPSRASEAAARAARHAFLAGTLSRRRIRTLWFGHQQDDIAETFLMRLGRGSGAGGLAAPRPVQAMPGGRVHLRPLLTLKKSELVAALRGAGASWREDASNAGDDHLRNRVRRDVLPAWLAAHADRDALAGAALTRELMEEDEEALETWRAELARLTRDGRLDLRPLAGRPRALLRRALHAWLLAQPDAWALSRQGFEVLLAAIASGTATRFSLGTKGFAVIRRGWLFYDKIKSGRRRRTRN